MRLKKKKKTNKKLRLGRKMFSPRPHNRSVQKKKYLSLSVLSLCAFSETSVRKGRFRSKRSSSKDIRNIAIYYIYSWTSIQNFHLEFTSNNSWILWDKTSYEYHILKNNNTIINFAVYTSILKQSPSYSVVYKRTKSLKPDLILH